MAAPKRGRGHAPPMASAGARHRGIDLRASSHSPSGGDKTQRLCERQPAPRNRFPPALSSSSVVPARAAKIFYAGEGEDAIIAMQAGILNYYLFPWVQN
jgi:hypothetical protein